MKKVIWHIIPYLLAFALGAIVFHSSPTQREKCIQKIPAKSISYITNNKVPVIVKEEKTRIVHDTVLDTIPIPADSAALMADWLTKRFYNPTILNDTNGIITAKFMITKNRLAKWEVKKKLFVHSYKIYEPPRRKFFVGGGLVAYPDRFSGFGAIMYQDRRDRAFVGAYDPIHRGVFVSAFFKISFNKKK